MASCSERWRSKHSTRTSSIVIFVSIVWNAATDRKRIVGKHTRELSTLAAVAVAPVRTGCPRSAYAQTKHQRHGSSPDGQAVELTLLRELCCLWHSRACQARLRLCCAVLCTSGTLSLVQPLLFTFGRLTIGRHTPLALIAICTHPSCPQPPCRPPKARTCTDRPGAFFSRKRQGPPSAA